MPPRPFPLALGIGTDICCISRIRELASRKSENGSLLPFVKRFLTAREQDDFFHKFKNEEFAVNKDFSPVVYRYLAGRWAAKEAVIKAVNHRRLTLRDVEIFQNPTSDNGGRGVYGLICDEAQSGVQNNVTSKSTPSVDAGPRGDGLPSRLAYDDLIGQVAKVSISHDGDYATAVCLTANEPMLRDVGGEAAARIP